MIQQAFRGRGLRPIIFCALFLALTGFVCNDDEEVHVPPPAGTGAEGFKVGHSFGHPDYDDDYKNKGLGDPCRLFTGGGYKVKKVVVKVYRLDASGNEVDIYPPIVYKDGVNFLNGNPNSPIGPGMGFKIPFSGAFKIRTTVYGYPCDELPPGSCLDCCDGDDSALPVWEEDSPWHEAKDSDFSTAYVSYPPFQWCI